MAKYHAEAKSLPPSASGRPSFIRNIDEIPEEAYERGGATGIAGASKDVGGAVGTRLLGLDVTVIPPGRKSSYLHRHSLKEEFFYVLSGHCRVRVGAAEYDLRPGDAVSRPAGAPEPHQFFNPFEEPCSVMMIGVMAGRGVCDVVEWPELKRILEIDERGERKISRMG